MLVHRLGSPSPELFGAKLPHDLLGEGCPRRVELGRVQIPEPRPRVICHDDAVVGGAVVVGGLESLDVEASEAPGCEDG